MKLPHLLLLSFVLLLSSTNTLASYTPELLKQKLSTIDLSDASSNDAIDSLLKEIKQEGEPKLRATLLVELMKALSGTAKAEQNRTLYDDVHAIAVEHKLNEIDFSAMFELARAEKYLDNSKHAFTLFETLVERAKKVSPESLGDIYAEMATLAGGMRDLAKMRTYYDLAIETLEQENKTVELARILASKGRYYSLMGYYDEALDALVQAVKYQIKLNDNTGLFASYLAIGNINHELANLEQAIEYYERALALDIKPVSKTASLRYAIAYANFELGRYDESLKHVDKALEIIRKSNRKENLAVALIGKASILIEIKRLNEATKLLQEAGEIVADLESEPVSQDLMLTYAKFYLADDNISLATQTIDKSLLYESPSDQVKEDQYKTASLIYEKAGNFEKAFNNLQKLRDIEAKKAKLNEEARIEKQQNQVALLKEQKNTAIVKQKLLQREKEVQLAESEKKQLWLYGVSALISALFLFSILYYRQAQKKRIAFEQSKLTMALMDQKNEFIANIAHDLKNPLTVIQLHLEALREGMVKRPDETHDILNNRISVLTNIIDDLRQVSQLELDSFKLKIETIAVVEWIRNEIEAYLPLVEMKKLTLASSIQTDDDTVVFADKSRLSQVLANLVKNSIRYTDAGGKIVIELSQTEQSVIITLEDSAPAVEKSELEHLFQRSYRAASNKNMSNQGSGLGLYICKQLIEAHHGNISADFSPLGGLAITIELPNKNLFSES